MKKLLFVLCSFILIFGSGCQNTKTRVVEGSVIGGLVGGAAGGIIGHQSGNAGVGAGIGIAAGALTGAVIGSQINKPQAETQTGSTSSSVQQPQAATQSGQLSMQQVINMSKQGLKDDEIIKEIHANNSKFSLSEESIKYLKNEGVSQRVIEAMQGK